MDQYQIKSGEHFFLVNEGFCCLAIMQMKKTFQIAHIFEILTVMWFVWKLFAS